MPHMRKCFDEIVQPGTLGHVHHVRIWWNYWAYPNRRLHPEGRPRDGRLEALAGERPDRPFDAYRFRAWRNFWDSAGGHTTDLATHLIDVVHWFLDLDHPTSASSAGGLFFSQDGRETPDVIHTLWTYPEKLVVTWEGNQHNGADGAGIDLPRLERDPLHRPAALRVDPPRGRDGHPPRRRPPPGPLQRPPRPGRRAPQGLDRRRPRSQAPAVPHRDRRQRGGCQPPGQRRLPAGEDRHLAGRLIAARDPVPLPPGEGAGGRVRGPGSGRIRPAARGGDSAC